MIYCILDIAELNNVNYGEVIQDSAATVRKNLADDKFIISFPANAVPAIADSATKYTHSEMLTYQANPANGWSLPPNPD
tara:strand:- start:965 stop:1201 length:237 start_codon:yes stop_codon:yes gene_type:complete